MTTKQEIAIKLDDLEKKEKDVRGEFRLNYEQVRRDSMEKAINRDVGYWNCLVGFVKSYNGPRENILDRWCRYLRIHNPLDPMGSEMDERILGNDWDDEKIIGHLLNLRDNLIEQEVMKYVWASYTCKYDEDVVTRCRDTHSEWSRKVPFPYGVKDIVEKYHGRFN